MKSEMNKKIPERKIKLVDELTNLAGTKRTTLVASIKNIPASQFQEITKKLRKNVVVKVPKRNLINLALENAKNSELKKLEDKIGDSTAILFSDLDSFHLAAQLLENTSPAKAKAGQEAPLDIVIPEGPTDLMPGPAISELGALGIQIQIEKGKISIKQPKTIVKKGDKISGPAADVMSKLDIKPFEIGFLPIAAYDKQDGKVYLKIEINKKGTIEALKDMYAKSLAFVVSRGYANKETIGFILAKASINGKILEQLLGKEPVEEKKEETQEKVEENSETKEVDEESTNKEGEEKNE